MQLKMMYQQKHISLFTILLLLTMSFNGMAGNHSRQLHISYPGIRSNAERDHAYSPLIFKGIQASFSIAYSVSKPQSSDLIMLNYAAGTISNKWDHSMNVNTAGIQTYKFYHRNKDAGSGFHWGWSNNNEFNTREVIDLKNFNNRNEYFTSFGPAVRYKRSFDLFNRLFHMESLAHVQLLGFKMQSSYVTSNPRGFEEPSHEGFDAFLNSIDLFYPGNAINIGIYPALHYELRSGTMLGISYRYDYLKLQGAHTVEKSRGTWHIGISAAL